MDIQFSNHGSLIGLAPRTDEASAWMSEHIPDAQCLGLVRFVEPRYADAIIDGMIDDGLTVGY